MDIIEGIKGERYDANPDDPPMTAQQRAGAVLLGFGSLALDCFTAGTAAPVEGVVKNVGKETA
jgi:hypothetical protein